MLRRRARNRAGGVRASPRASRGRAKLGIPVMPTAMSAAAWLRPRTAISAIANRMPGSASSTSTMRISSVSRQPPKKPATRPTGMPIAPAITTAPAAVSSEVRAPKMTRARMSRPSSSVPNQCAADGGSSELATSWASGSSSSPANAAASTSSRRNSIAASAALRPARRRNILMRARPPAGRGVPAGRHD